MRGYEHPPSGLWMLDVWAATAVPQPHAFNGAREFVEMTNLPADETVRTFERIVGVVGGAGDGPVAYGDGWLRLTEAVGAALGQPVFFFAADDEEYDLACSADGGGITRVGFRMEQLGIRYSGGQWVVTPRTYGDDEVRWSEGMLAELRALEGVRVEAPEARESESYLEYANAEWPAEAANPDKVIGGWGWAMELERTCRPVFEHVPRSA